MFRGFRVFPMVFPMYMCSPGYASDVDWYCIASVENCARVADGKEFEVSRGPVTGRCMQG